MSVLLGISCKQADWRLRSLGVIFFGENDSALELSGPLVPLSLLYDVRIDQWVQTSSVRWPIITFPISCLPNDFSHH